MLNYCSCQKQMFFFIMSCQTTTSTIHVALNRLHKQHLVQIATSLLFRTFLGSALHWYLYKSWSENCILWHPSTRSKVLSISSFIMVSLKCFCVSKSNVLEGHCRPPYKNMIFLWYHIIKVFVFSFTFSDPNQRLCDSVCGWCGVLPDSLPHIICSQCI